MSIFHCINTIIFIGVLPMCTIKSINVPQHFMKSSMVIKNNHKWVWWSWMDIWKCALSHKDFWFLITLWINRSSYISLIQVILEHQLFWSILHLLWKQLWHNTYGVFFWCRPEIPNDLEHDCAHTKNFFWGKIPWIEPLE